MKEGWKEIHFKDFITLNRGFDLPNNKIEEGDYPVVASTSIKAYNKKYKVSAPCVITGRSGSLGTVQFVNQNSWPLNTTLYVKDFKKHDPRFVYYFLQTMNFDSFNSGAGVPTLNQNHLHFLKINIPKTTDHQQRIASILYTYDDLIEVNNKRIELLEQSARELYKEWFVRMRFPNYQNTKFNKGIPEGWEEKRLEEIANIKMGQSPKSEYYNEEQIGLPFHQGVGNYGKRFPSHSIYCTDKKRIAEKGDILFSVRAPVGRINIANDKLIIGRGLAAMNHKEKYNSYLFYLLDNIFTNEDIIGNGSIFNAVTKEELAGFKILVNKNLSHKFENIIIDFDRKVELLYKQNQQLTEIRNRLLPRLISGKLEVKA